MEKECDNNVPNIQETEIDEKAALLGNQEEEEDEFPENSVEKEIKVHWIKKIIMVSGAYFFVVTIGFMTIAGYQNFRSILIEEKVYRWLCPKDYTSKEPCKPQIFRFGLMLSLAATLLNTLVFIIGPANDIVGPKIVGTCGVVLNLIGTLVLSFSSEKFDGYVWGYVIMTVGGCFIFVTFLHFNNMLSERMRFFFNSGIMSSQDTGALMFTIFQVICENTKAKLSYLLWGYTSIILLAFIYILILQPWLPYPHGMKRKVSKDKKVCQKVGFYLLDYLKNCWISFKSIKTWCFMVYAMTGTTFTYFYLQTFSEQLKWLSNSKEPKKVDSLVYTLGIFLIFIGVISSLIMACMMNIFSFKKVEGKSWKNCMRYFILPIAFFFISVLIFIQTICSVIPNLNVQYVTMIAFISVRACYFSMFTQFTVFFFPNIAMSVIGVFTFAGGMTTLSNYGWQVIALDDYFWYNIAFGTVFTLQSIFMGVATIYWIYLEERNSEKPKDVKPKNENGFDEKTQDTEEQIE